MKLMTLTLQNLTAELKGDNVQSRNNYLYLILLFVCFGGVD